MFVKDKAQNIFYKKLAKIISEFARPSTEKIVYKLEVWLGSAEVGNDINDELKNNWIPCCNDPECEYLPLEERKIKEEINKLVNQVKGGN